MADLAPMWIKVGWITLLHHRAVQGTQTSATLFLFFPFFFGHRYCSATMEPLLRKVRSVARPQKCGGWEFGDSARCPFSTKALRTATWVRLLCGENAQKFRPGYRTETQHTICFHQSLKSCLGFLFLFFETVAYTFWVAERLSLAFHSPETRRFPPQRVFTIE